MSIKWYMSTYLGLISEPVNCREGEREKEIE